MKIHLFLFAGLRERFGASEMSLEVPEKMQARQIFQFLCREEGEAEKFRRCTLFAVDENYISPQTILKEGQTLALIPPVAGG